MLLAHRHMRSMCICVYQSHSRCSIQWWLVVVVSPCSHQKDDNSSTKKNREDGKESPIGSVSSVSRAVPVRSNIGRIDRHNKNAESSS